MTARDYTNTKLRRIAETLVSLNLDDDDLCEKVNSLKVRADDALKGIMPGRGNPDALIEGRKKALLVRLRNAREDRKRIGLMVARFRKFDKLVTYKEFADALNDMGEKPRRAEFWTPSNLRALLKEPDTE